MPILKKQVGASAYTVAFPTWMSNDARSMISTAMNLYGSAENALPQYKDLQMAIDADSVAVPNCVANGSWILREQ